ncbi:MAG: hypothetical protein DSZ31_01460 [Gammaproteobacteria bacterium]|nr:MAG: hypothetical protein DSZ31_01460 [Gammaproteobacteria bacterium]RTZ67125.1 MAG: hypothetical protein DSZ30_06085 [Aquificaceae bacterium]
MRKVCKPFFRSPLSKFKPFRELGAFLCKQPAKFVAVSRRDIDAFMVLDIEDEYGKRVLKSGKIETPEDEFIKRLVKPGWSVLDIGAHWGGFSILFGKLVGKEGKVFSFEASSKNYKLLRWNIFINNLKGVVETYHYAVGDREGEVQLKVASTSSGHNSVLRYDLPTKEVETVKQIALDNFLKATKVDFVKMDIEGYEYFALKGMENIIKNNSLWLFIEFSPQFMGESLTKELYGFLKFYFEEVYLAHGGKIFKTDWDTAYRISLEKGQRNLFLRKG